MKNKDMLKSDGTSGGHAAEVSIRIGPRATLDARLSSAGLLSVGALVSGILLSTAVIVFVAGRNRQTPSP